MKKFLTFGLAMTVAMGALTGCGGGSAKSELKFTTGGDQGTYYGFGTVLAGQVSSSTDTTVTAITSGGSQAMFFKINTFGEESFLDKLREIL